MARNKNGNKKHTDTLRTGDVLVRSGVRRKVHGTDSLSIRGKAIEHVRFEETEEIDEAFEHSKLRAVTREDWNRWVRG